MHIGEPEIAARITVGEALVIEAEQRKPDGSDAGLVGPGGTSYRLASRAECLRCHTPWNGFANGFQPQELADFPAFAGQPAREVDERGAALLWDLVKPMPRKKDSTETTSWPLPPPDVIEKAPVQSLASERSRL